MDLADPRAIVAACVTRPPGTEARAAAAPTVAPRPHTTRRSRSCAARVSISSRRDGLAHLALVARADQAYRARRTSTRLVERRSPPGAVTADDVPDGTHRYARRLCDHAGEARSAFFRAARLRSLEVRRGRRTAAASCSSATSTAAGGALYLAVAQGRETTPAHQDEGVRSVQGPVTTCRHGRPMARQIAFARSRDTTHDGTTAKALPDPPGRTRPQADSRPFQRPEPKLVCPTASRSCSTRPSYCRH